jgi:predicted glutamine amidotransferase
MCDLFALSATRDYSAPKSLPLFAMRASKNMDGWGIGYFKKNRAFVEKSAKRVYASDQIHDSFQRLARLVNSRIILSHVRFHTSGLLDECHAHPFVLEFGGHNWLFAHNGRAPAVEEYRTTGREIEGALSDSARTFEYLRDQLCSYAGCAPLMPTLFEALLISTARLINEYPGEYNYLLTNGLALFAFTNHRQFMLLKGSKELEGGLLLTTLQHALSNENWLRVAKGTNRQGLLMMISGTDVIFRQPL